MSVAPATRPAPVARHADGASIGQGLLLAMAVASGVTVANLYYIQPLLAEIGGTLEASAAAMGLVATLGQLGFATGLLFFVPLGDISDRRALIVATMAGAVVSLLATAVAPSFGWLAASVFCLGVFSVTPQMLVPLAAHLAAPEARGRAVGIVMSGLLIGILLSRTASGIISAAAGWRTMYWIASALTLIVAAGMAAILPRGAGTSQLSYGRLLASLWQLTRTEPVLRESAFAGAMLFGAFSAFWSMLSFRLASPPFHYGSEMAGLFGLVGVAGAAAAPIAGRLADRLNPRGIVRLSLIVTVSAFVVLAVLGNTIAGLVVGVILLDAGVQAGHVTNLARVHALAPETRNRLTTIYMVTFFIGGACGSAMAAYAWSHWGWNGVCAVGFGMPLLALIALCRPVPELTTRSMGTV